MSTRYFVDDRDGGCCRTNSDETAAQLLAAGWHETTADEYESLRRKIWGMKEDE